MIKFREKINMENIKKINIKNKQANYINLKKNMEELRYKETD